MEAKQVKDLLEAYSSIYEKKEEPEMEEGEKKESKMEEGEGKESEKDEGGKHKEGKHPKGKEEKGEKVTEKEGKETETEKEMKESADLFDYLLEYLVAEGYADTNKAALAIMANMGEGWKQSILEQESKFTVTALDKKLNTPAYQRLQQGNPAYKAGGTGANKLPPA